MKLKKGMKKILALMLAVLVITMNVVPVAADAATETKIQESVTNRQYFVYKLTKIMTDSELKLSRIADAEFFDEKTKTGLLGILSFQDIGAAFFGSDTLEAKYYRKIMAECVMPGMVKDSAGVDWALAGVAEETLYSKTNERLKELKVPEAELKDIKFVHEAFNVGTTLAEDSMEAGTLLNKITRYSSAHLNALELVGEYAEPGTAMSGSAKLVVEAADSAEFKDAFKNYMTFLFAEVAEGLVDWSLSAITLSASEWVGNCFDIISGDEYEEEMDEMFYLNFQNQIFSTFHQMTEKYPNVLQSHYTVAEIKDLTDLTLLYLRCGQLGFGIHYPENADACAAAYRELQQMEFPWIEEGGNASAVTANVSAYDFNVPGTISKGDYYVIFGTVSSDEVINSVRAEVTGANGYLCASADNVNSNSYDIGALDAQMRFNDLMPGDYTYQVTVTTASGEHKVISSGFQVQPENGEMTIVGYRLPHTMNVGDIFYVCGTVNSRTPMSSVMVEIRDEAGNYMTGGTANGSYTSFDLSWLDRYVEFNKVPSGRYNYIIKAVNSYGEEILVNQTYLVR